MALALVVSSALVTQVHAEDLNVSAQGSASVNTTAPKGGFFSNLFNWGGDKERNAVDGIAPTGDNERGDNKGMMQNGVYGTVTAVNGNTITVTDKQSNTVYTVDATNAKIDKNRSAITVSGISVGDTVMVGGPKTGTSVAAVVIHDGVMMKGGPMMNRGEILGTVTAVSGNTLTVSSKTQNENGGTATVYIVNASGATVQKAGVASTISAIAVGDQVRIKGTVTGTTVNSVVSINDGKKEMPEAFTGNGQPIVGGTVTAVSGSTITITNKSNVTYTIDANAATFTKNGASSTISNIAVGDEILAQGTVNGNAVSAVSITDQAKVQGKGKGFFGSIGNFFSRIFGF